MSLSFPCMLVMLTEYEGGILPCKLFCILFFIVINLSQQYWLEPLLACLTLFMLSLFEVLFKQKIIIQKTNRARNHNALPMLPINVCWPSESCFSLQVFCCRTWLSPCSASPAASLALSELPTLNIFLLQLHR